MIQKFMESGYDIVDFEEIADIYIINTCTVTNMSDKKSRQMIRRAKQRNDDAVIVAVGCYVQVSKKEVEKIDEIDLALGTSEKNDIVSLVEKYIVSRNNKYDISDVMKQKQYIDFGDITYTEKTRGVIKVQDGCDRFCSYCIIPFARGRVRSREIYSVVNEVTDLANNGVKEVVITGIHVASYGKDLKEDISLIDLLEEINKVDGIERIRLGSLEPTIITDEFVHRLKKLEKICHHFHLSLQSACNETLKRMNRRYSIEEFMECIERLRNAYTDVVLTTDIIVGFPGETDEEFEITYNNLKKIKFYMLHVFKYSKRKGTKAAEMENQLPNNIKEQRSKRLIELSNKSQKEFNKKYIGKNVKVLWEQKECGKMKGHTSNYIVVYTENENAVEDEIQGINISDTYQDGIIGQ